MFCIRSKSSIEPTDRRRNAVGRGGSHPFGPLALATRLHHLRAVAKLELSGKVRKQLRGMAHGLDAAVQVGQEGISPGVIAAIDAALLAHELIKVRMHQPTDKKSWADELAESTGSALCGLVGHTVVLYRPHPEKPKIRLDAASDEP